MQHEGSCSNCTAIAAGADSGAKESIFPEETHGLLQGSNSHLLIDRACRSDVTELQALHRICFPVKYERSFFVQVACGMVGAILCRASDAANQHLSCPVEEPGPIVQHGSIAGAITYVTYPVKNLKDPVLRGDCTWFGGSAVYICTLGVLSHYRSLGIASVLLDQLLSATSLVQSKTRPTFCVRSLPDALENVKVVYLHCDPGNSAAIHMYRKRGFQEICSFSKYYSYSTDSGADHITGIPFPTDPTCIRSDSSQGLASRPALILALYAPGAMPPLDVSVKNTFRGAAKAFREWLGRE